MAIVRTKCSRYQIKCESILWNFAAIKKKLNYFEFQKEKFLKYSDINAGNGLFFQSHIALSSPLQGSSSYCGLKQLNSFIIAHS